MNFNEEQLNKIQAKSMGRFLQKLGYEKFFPRAVVYGTSDYGGLGCKQLYSYCMWQKIESIIGNMNSKASCGHDMDRVLGWAQIQSGISFPILEQHQNIDYIQNSWFTPLQRFLTILNGHITVEKQWQPELQRENDKIIMDEVLKLSISSSTRQTFNNWRMYMRVNNFSDITSNSGDSILPEYLDKNNIHRQDASSKLLWPNQVQPDISTFSIWTSIIRQITGYASNRQFTPMGEWKVSPHKYRKYTCLLHNTNQYILI
jgi:hypothetical protein